MGGYRSDLEAAQARIEQLEAAVDRVEEERARLARDIEERAGASTASPLPWIVAGGAVVVALVLGGAALAGSSGPSAPVATIPATLEAAPEVDPEPEPPAPDPVSPAAEGLEETNRDTAFFGQYWEARVEDPGESGLAPDTRCLITTDPGLHFGAGVARVVCGDTVLHHTTVSPPWRDNEGFCHYRDRELVCAPVRGSSRPGCWVSTAARQASCPMGVQLRIHTRMRDPRERPPPAMQGWRDPSRGSEVVASAQR
ncbi:MAG: hypothetical protein R3B82_24335 [Sandaracinaceae bacterium]